MDNKLIFDIGAHNGDDSAYYLRRGYRVVAVEANPAMAEHLRRRFPDEIESGTLIVLNIGIAAEEGQLEFWVCDDHSDWSSFHRSIASRDNARHHKITVPTHRFATVLLRYGIPFYCKIDIEENDRLCLQDLRPNSLPAFISVELSNENGGILLELLKGLGYRKFKVVSQVTRTQPILPLAALNFLLPGGIRDFVMRVDRRLRGVRSKGDWRFPYSSSGPFGEDTPGPWRNYDVVWTTWKRLHDLDLQHQAGGIGGDWHDVHAAL